MKIKILMFLAIITSTSAFAKVTEADLARDMAWAASQHTSVPQSEIDEQWEDFNKPPNIGGSAKVTWAQMPSGSQCGIYMMSGGSLNGYKQCQGHNPRSSCPSGFSRATLGYFEAGGGDRNFTTCMKN